MKIVSRALLRKKRLGAQTDEEVRGGGGGREGSRMGGQKGAETRRSAGSWLRPTPSPPSLMPLSPPPPPPLLLLLQVLREVAVMKLLSHPNVVSLYEVIDDKGGDKFYMLQEYMELGPVMTEAEYNT